VGELFRGFFAKALNKIDRVRTVTREAAPLVWKDLANDLESLRSVLRAYTYGVNLDEDDALRRAWILLDLATTAAVGMIRDRVIERGSFDIINDVDLRVWLRKHGASRQAVNSAPVQSLYDLVFAYQGGDLNKPACEAGTALRAVLRLLFDRQGPIMYRFDGSMGDRFFVPLYNALKQRGVRFKFMHEVVGITLERDPPGTTAGSGDPRCVTHVDFVAPRINSSEWFDKDHPKASRQLYDPLRWDGGKVAFWSNKLDPVQVPNEPILERYQLVLTGKDTTDHGFQFSYFDQLVVAIPIAALKEICRDITVRLDRQGEHRFQRIRDMFEHVQTVPTCAMQLWLKPNFAGLGWRTREDKFSIPDKTINSGFPGVYQTWADMSQVRGQEKWPQTAAVGSILYFCGAWPDAPSAPRVRSKDERIRLPSSRDMRWENFQAGELRRLRDDSQPFLDDNMLRHFPGVARRHDGAKDRYEFDPTQLADPNIYYRVNVTPSERYTLSVPGSSRFRLKTGATGIDNIFLAGDWIDNGFNAGCMEAGAMSGLQAARAALGSGEPIPGETDR
jgi:hypothetical protein